MTYNTNRTARKLQKALGQTIPSQYRSGVHQWAYVAATHEAGSTTLYAACNAGDLAIQTNGPVSAGAQIIVGEGGPLEVGSTTGSAPYTLNLTGRGVPFAQSSGATVQVLSTVDLYLDGWQNPPTGLPSGVTPTLTTGVRCLAQYAPAVGHVVFVARGTGLSRSDRVVLGHLSTFSNQWVEPLLDSGWSNFGGAYQACAFRKIGDMVQIRGTLTGGTGSIFTLPAGYAPLAREGFICSGNSLVARVDVLASGVVTLAVGAATAGLTLGTIQFSTS